ncbi:MAG: phenylalanyl-tRNA synthetase subunit alpha [Candidatus Peribacteria bacterium]|nr:phenylalanyl-tRNA synthetase subunit alpha [Candidatus Peribacteria bacterium]
MIPSSDTWQLFLEQISMAPSADALETLDLQIFGRKQGNMTAAFKELGTLSQEARIQKAQELNGWKQKLTDAMETKKKELTAASHGSLAGTDGIDVTLELPEQETGHLHLIPEFIERVEEVFGRMGFEIAEGPEIETEEFNFNMLNIPATHPARDGQDTFWLEGSEDLLLRTQTSPVQIHYMQTHKPPFRMICPGRVYRKDADATHSPMFHQFEGLMIGKDISLANMKAVMITAIRELISPDVHFRFRTGFFPFVEPGLEVDIRWQGDETKSREGKWLEVVGCGMVHANVLKNVGIDPDEYQGFAFGFGIERMIMIKHQIPDLRAFYTGDLRFLRQFS